MNLRALNRVWQRRMRSIKLIIGRLLWDRKTNKNPRLDMDKVNKILFLRYDGKIGDMVINTLMFRELKKIYSAIQIDVVTAGLNGEIIKNNPYVNQIYRYEKKNMRQKKIIQQIQAEKYDLLIDFTEDLKIDQIRFINLCKAKQNIGFAKNDWRLFDISIDCVLYDQHITTRYQRILEYLGIKNPNLKYDIFLNKKQEEFGFNFRKLIKEKYLIALNPYGASKYRTFTKEKIREIVEEIFKISEDIALTLLFPPEKIGEIKEIAVKINNRRLYLPINTNSLLENTSLIKNADLIISPDTSVVHMAVAFEKKLIAIYRPDLTEEKNAIIWGPNLESAIQIFSQKEKSKNGTLDINSFSISELKDNVKRILIMGKDN